MAIDITFNEVYGFKTALRALRRPMNKERDESLGDTPTEDDLRLMVQLAKRGDDHAKFMRMIGAGITVKAPRYFWLELDTYKLGRFDLDEEHCSESTMHRKISEPFMVEDFDNSDIPSPYLGQLNGVRELVANGTCSLEGLKAMIPEGFLQTRDMLLNYQAMRRIYHARKNHALSQWREFCAWMVDNVPYSQLITEGN
jgi:hypothetical protein